jgi:exodeoxyribonuclease V alpha subunit
MAKLQGHIERITFSSEENGFSVCKLKVKGEQNLVTIVGNMVNPVPGEFVELDGTLGIRTIKSSKRHTRLCPRLKL